MKRIAIFADGTWNAPDRGLPTNVLRMARAIRPVVDGTEQVAFYDWGVGTDRKTVSGGISGAGIDKNILDCYRFLVHNYRPGDQLFFFGFSRGAYTVRSLAGFIRNAGLLRREHAGRISGAYELYRKRTRRSHPDADEAARFRRDHAVADITPIEFVGAWDTVGALGVPVPFWGTLGESRYLFHDTAPSRIIRHARHAVSIDENREDFAPTLWDDKPGMDLRQVWFAGVHSDVGGGYKARGLSDHAGTWMLREAENAGLRFEPHLALNPDHRDKAHNERSGIYRMRPELIREIAGPVHASVRRRWEEDIDNYQRRGKALRRLLDARGGDWTQVALAD